jgi:hypothetical protein
MIYDLDNKGGGQIIGASDNTQPAFRVESKAAGYPAIACYSTASGSVIQATAISGGPAFDGDSVSTTQPAGDFRSAATIGPALIVGRTVCALPTIAPMKFLHPSCASAAVMEFQGGFISCTSIDIISAANADYVLPISLNGVVRYIPLMNSTSIKGGATFA